MKIKSDVLIIGSGIAGLTLALEVAQKRQVALVTKRALKESNTFYSQGGIAAVVGAQDSIENHVQDTLLAGAGLCDAAVVQKICQQGAQVVQQLTQHGVAFALSQSGEHELGLEGGHSHRRILHAGDITGRAIEQVLAQRVLEHPNITVYENAIAIDLIVSDAAQRSCLGAYVLDQNSKQVQVFLAQTTVLACGGGGKIYLYTTNPDIATGDGIAMAFRAGVPVKNLEFVQFHPTCLYHPQAKSFLISEALRGEGAKLLLQNGATFMEKHHPLKELAPRDIVARAIDAELKKSGDEFVYLDISHRGAEFVETRFPNLVQICKKFGYDLARQAVPVVPAAHYFCGGVETQLDGSTCLESLYVIGESACTGLHGANRLASNSLLEGLVMANACADSLKQRPPFNIEWAEKSVQEWNPGNARDPNEQVVIAQNWDEIRRFMWNYVGIVRTDKRLQRALRRIELLQMEIQDYYWDFIVTADLIELRNLALVAECVIRCALARKESRGLHYNADYPSTNDLLFKHDTVLFPPRN